MFYKLLRSFGYAWQGIFNVVKSERNMKIHVAAAFVVAILAWKLSFSRWELAVLVLTVFGVLALELMNTAIEKVVDLISPKQHPLAKAAKDAAAGAVLIFAMGSIVIAYLLFYQHLIH